MERVIETLDEMVRDSVIEDYVIGGATALLYFSIPNFITEDINVFVYLKAKPSSTIVDVSPLYKYLRSKKNAIIEGEYIVVDGFPIQFLIPYDELTREAFINATRVTAGGAGFKIFNLEYGMAIMIQLAKEKYIERLRTLVRHRLYDEKSLGAILENHGLAAKWGMMKQRLENQP
jgi:hypothetical protein